jgi:hypothetical protein
VTKVTDPQSGKIRAYKCNHDQTTGDCPAPAYVKSDDIEKLVQQVFGFWHFHSERTPISPDERAVKDAEDKLDDLVRRFNAVAEDDARLEAMGPEKFSADLRRRRIAIEQATADLNEARAAIERDTHRPIMLGDEWDAFDTEHKRSILRRAIDSVYVTREHFEPGPHFTSVDPDLFNRVLIKWAHEDHFDKPGRGHRDYTIEPIPWPESEPLVTEEVAEAERITAGAGSSQCGRPILQSGFMIRVRLGD